MKAFIINVSIFGAIGLGVSLSAFYTSLYIFDLYPDFSLLRETVQNDCDFMLFGSSVNKYVDEKDTDKRSIAEMLDEKLPQKEVKAISNFAYTADIYLEFIKYIIKHKKERLPTIIIPINLRYFAPQWNYRPTYQFTKEKYYLQGYPYIINFKDYKKYSATEFMKLPIYYEGKEVGTVESYEEREILQDSIIELKMGFISHYMQPLSSNNPKLTSLKSICELAKTNKLNIIFYITPIDFMKAESIGMKNFKREVLKNTALVKSIINGFDLLDLSMELPSNYFNYERRPNEHLNMKGRNEVANYLRMHIK